MSFGWVLFFASSILLWKRRGYSSLLRQPLLFFSLFSCFLIVRAVWAVVMRFSFRQEISEFFPYQKYLYSPIQWSFYLTFIMLSMVLFTKRKSVERLLTFLSWSSFFIAINAIPPLLQNKQFAFLDSTGEFRFFYPPLYFKKWVEIYLLSPITHQNFVGDFTAVGAFSALGISFYAALLLKDFFHDKTLQKSIDNLMPFLGRILLYLVIALTNITALLVLFSRGSIASFFISFLVAAVFLVVRLRLFRYIKFYLAGGLIFFIFLAWAGNFYKAWKEVQTLQTEFDNKDSSVQTNIEGAKRAIEVFKEYPIWGIGTGGFSGVSRHYASPGTLQLSNLANFQAMSHYPHLLAEEGLGAVFYFLFLIFYLVEFFKRVINSKSRFNIIAGVSLFATVLMILIHAGINDLMQRFSTSMIVYICLGASLGSFKDES